MTTNTDEGVTVLDTETCWQRLAGQEFGRLAVAVDHHPDVFPVNFAMIDGAIVFRTAEGTKLLAAVIAPSVAFEVDGVDTDTDIAWSVVVKGVAEEVPVFDLIDDDAFPVFPWQHSPKSRFVRIAPHEISGREFHVARHRPTH